ncbi:class I adenylate-forming enzyme family protein [Sodalis sp. (in: enterobacteria)]|uniref:class I adenylate-forming enzyme family protein n=1 Tax=Sodalis sp. (in: enterobacteria) TaxID=1898979 RepID=UPI003F33EDC4
MWQNLGKIIGSDLSNNDPALIDCVDFDNPRTYTFSDIDNQADACVRGLVKRGLAKGDCVAILSINRAEYLIAYLGIMRAGMVAMPLNYKLATETLHFILQDCNAKFALVDGPRQQELPPATPSVRLDSAKWKAFLDPGAFDTVVPADDTCAMILYTSGSTGRPKGVKLSHRGHIWTLTSRLLHRRDLSGERMIIAAPMFHMNALGNCKFALAGHACIVLLPNFQTRQFIAAIDRHRVTWITSVPTMMAMVVSETEALSQIQTAQVKFIRMGSAPATQQLYRSVQAAFPNATLAGGYGTTEAGPIVFGPTGGRKLPNDGGLGWPLPEVEVRLVDENGADASEGVLWMRTPANMLGYLNLPEKTAQVLTDDGWYISGDLFRRDESGCYYFIGRADDMFNCGGENIWPGEVEQVIEHIPEVMQACVVPINGVVE